VRQIRLERALGKDKSADWLRLNAKELDALAERMCAVPSAVSGGAYRFGLEGGRIMVSAEAMIELLDRLARASEQIRDLRSDIIHRGEVPGDADIAIVIARHHIDRASGVEQTA
jgi:hypothetical protein